jgi:hypothetical protein
MLESAFSTIISVLTRKISAERGDFGCCTRYQGESVCARRIAVRMRRSRGAHLHGLTREFLGTRRGRVRPARYDCADDQQLTNLFRNWGGVRGAVGDGW